MDEYKVTFAYPNWVADDDTVLSANVDFSEELPLANAQNRVLAILARTDGIDPDTNPIIKVDFTKPRAVGCVAIAAHNFSTAGQIRIKLYAESALSTLLADSGAVDVWPEMMPTDELEWEFDTFWDGRISEEDRERYTALFTYFFDQAWAPEALTIEIVDPDNTDEFLQFGRIFAGGVFQPTTNMSYGSQRNFEDPTVVDVSLDQTEYFDRQRLKRVATISLDYLTEEDDTKIVEMRRKLGISGELIFAQSLRLDLKYYERTFLGRLRQMNPITHPYLNNYSNVIEVLEIN